MNIKKLLSRKDTVKAGDAVVTIYRGNEVTGIVSFLDYRTNKYVITGMDLFSEEQIILCRKRHEITKLRNSKIVQSVEHLEQVLIR